MDIKLHKLLEILNTEVDVVKNGSFLSSTVFIGQFEGIQLHLKITKDPEDFMYDNTNECVITND